jgi:hypothetical protein
MHLSTGVIRLVVLVISIMALLRRAAGRRGLGLGLASIVFLVTRWPVLIIWGIGSLFWILLLGASMTKTGHTSIGDEFTVLWISLLCGAGLAVLTVGPVFLIARMMKRAPEIPLEPGEVPLFEELANHFLNGEGRGGNLLVTSRRIAFRPHRFNVQLATWSLPLAEIARVEPDGERLVLVHARGRTEPELVIVMGALRIAQHIGWIAGMSEAQRVETARARGNVLTAA